MVELLQPTAAQYDRIGRVRSAYSHFSRVALAQIGQVAAGMPLIGAVDFFFCIVRRAVFFFFEPQSNEKHTCPEMTALTLIQTFGGQNKAEK